MSSIRLNFLVEGQTEEAFVKMQLKPHLDNRGISTKVQLVKTSRDGRGGLGSYKKQVRKDITVWMGEEAGDDIYFTTMFDLFRLPKDFPGYSGARAVHNPQERAAALEAAMGEDIGDHRLLPYIQVYEFEALVLADPMELWLEYPEDEAGVRRLDDMVNRFPSPEMINDGPETAPSKRIEKEIRTYSKKFSGPTITKAIGLPKLRNKCPHFGAWIHRLESLGPVDIWNRP